MGDELVFARAHQRVALDIDFEGRLTGSACLTIYPNNPSLRCVNLHASPLLDIRSVTLSSPTDEDAFLPTPASFSHTAPAQPLPLREPPIELTSHPEIKRKTWAAMGEQDEGELAILVSNGWVRLVQKGDSVEFAPIHIQVDYSLSLGGDVTEGIVFRRESQNEIPHMFLSPTSHLAARIWTPCLDSMWERCTWELEFTVPHTLPDRGDLPPFTVVSSGELMEQITHPHNPNKTIFYYLQASPTSVQHILFAAGPFEMHLVHQEEKKAMLGFCLPGDERDMENSTAFMSKAMTFYSTEFGVYPFSDYKMVFVSEPRSDHAVGATMSLFSAELLHPPDIIDQVYETRQVLGLALAQQWLGVNIIPRTLADTWVVNGLCIYIYGLFLRHLQGNNEYRFRLKREIDRCTRMDQGDKAPICQPGTADIDVEFINIKAPLVMHILDKFLTKTGTSSGLSRVIPKIFLAALSDELPGNTIATHSFFKYCRKASGLDLGSFQDQWVFGSGCPKMRVQTNFIRKKFVVELNVEQTQPATSGKKRPTQFFEGSLTIRIHEADGAPFEHLVDIKTSQKTFTLPFNTKYKRTKRSGRIAARFDHLRDQMVADEAEDDALRDTDRTDVFAYPPWDNERERHEWRVAEWTEEQADAMVTEGSGYEWIRIDPDCEWLAVFEFPEKPWYWISQLQGDKDVIAQLEAVQNLTAYSSYPVVASELARTVLVSNYFYRVRTEAAKALVFLDTPDAQYMGSFLLLKLLDHFTPDAKNDFSDIAQYFVLKSVISAISLLREPAKPGETVRMVPLRNARDAIIETLDLNDNTDNRYSDCSYTATLISGLGNMLGSAPDVRAATAIEKAITLDRLLPSFGNVVTKAGLEAHLKSIMIGQITNDPRLFLGYTREGNLRSLRLLAFDALLLCKPLGRSQALATYLLNVITKDSSLVVRRHVARAMSESILMALAFGDIINASARVIDTSVDEAARQKETDKAIVKALRQDYERKPEVMGRIGETLKANYAQFDDAVRLAFIKVAEMTTASNPEPLPGNIIKLHTPVSEVPPSAPPPKIRLSLPASVPPEISANFSGSGSAPLKLVIPGKKVVPAQKKGLPEADLKAINNALNKLTSHVCSEFFRGPVDPIRDGAPDYLTIVKEPMDLQTARTKLNNGQYSTRQEFVKDMERIVSNCILYNGELNDIGRAARQFQGVFRKLWAKTEATLDSAKIAAPVIIQPIAPALPPTSVPAPQSARAPSAEAPAAPAPSLKFKLPAPVVKSEPAVTPSAPTPMAPPPVPQRKISIAVPNKKRPRDVDDILADEVDAIAAPAAPKKKSDTPETAGTGSVKKARRSPEKQVQPVQIQVQKKKKEAELDAYLDDPVDTPKPVPSTPAVPTTRAPTTPSAPAAVMNTPSDRSAGPPVPKGSHVMPFRPKRAKALVATLQKDPSAIFFLRPVDPELDGVPTYYKEISKPRDLGTIMKKVEGKEGRKYQTMQQLADDIELVFSNCRQFNGPGEISALADATEATFEREWPKAVDPRMTPEERKAMQALLSRALKEPMGLIFREAVNPVELGIPTYFDVIPEDDARDLSLIKSRVDKGRYTTHKQIDDEFHLMLENARVFNGDGEITDTANKFGRWWDAQRRKMD